MITNTLISALIPLLFATAPFLYIVNAPFAKRDHSLTFLCSHPLTGWPKDSLATKKAREAQFGTLANFTPAIIAQGRVTMQRNAAESQPNRQVTRLAGLLKGHGHTLCQIVAELNAAGYRTRRDRDFRGRSHELFLQVFLSLCWRTKSTSGLNQLMAQANFS